MVITVKDWWLGFHDEKFCTRKMLLWWREPLRGTIEDRVVARYLNPDGAPRLEPVKRDS